MRETTPLIFLDKDLICVPKLGIHHTFQAKGLTMGLNITLSDPTFV
jgi:hypothetical protein